MGGKKTSLEVREGAGHEFGADGLMSRGMLYEVIMEDGRWASVRPSECGWMT